MLQCYITPLLAGQYTYGNSTTMSRSQPPLAVTSIVRIQPPWTILYRVHHLGSWKMPGLPVSLNSVSSCRFQQHSNSCWAYGSHHEKYVKLFFCLQEAPITNEWGVHYFIYHWHNSMLVRVKHVLRDDFIQLKLLKCGTACAPLRHMYQYKYSA